MTGRSNPPEALDVPTLLALGLLGAGAAIGLGVWATHPDLRDALAPEVRKLIHKVGPEVARFLGRLADSGALAPAN